MNRVRLSVACPPMPEAFHQRIVDTIEELEEKEMLKPKKMSILLIAALIGALLLAGLAYAATRSGILGDLFGSNAPSEAAQALLQPGESVEQNGVRLTIDEYLLDGNKLHMTCTFLSNADEPLVCALEFPTVNGAGVAGGSFSRGIGMDLLLDLKKEAPVTLSMSAHLGDGVHTAEPIEIGIIGYAMEPLVELPAWGFEIPPAEGFPGVYDIWSDEVIDLLDESRNVAEAYEKLGYTKTVAELPIKIVVSPESLQAAGHTAVDGQDTFDFPDYMIKIVRADFGAASTMVELHIYPKRPFGAYEEDPLINRSYTLLGPDGQDLVNGVIGGWEGGIMEDGEENGEPLHFCWTGDWNPIEAPERVTFMPYLDLRGGGRAYIEDEAVTVTLTK